MIVRIVRLHFQHDKVSDFMLLFAEVSQDIRAFEGCIEMNLFKENKEQAVYYTISKWNSEVHLENYRKSELFRQTWTKTKALFAYPAQAHTLSLAE